MTDTKLKLDSWFSEVFNEQQSFGLSMDKLLYHEKSQYQDILVFQNKAFGKVLVLDGAYMLSDLDEHMYHKSLTSYGMQNIPSDRNDLEIFVIGAGDGGVVRDLLKNHEKRIKKITMVEIDEDVINISKKFFPQIASAFGHPKLDLRCEDAIGFIAQSKDATYDLVLCDSTDPVGFAAGLIEEDFYSNVRRIMKPESIYCTQSGSPFFQKDELAKVQRNLSKIFAERHTYYAPMLVYPGCIWSYTAAGHKITNKANIDIGDFVKHEHS
jgi:spermidine synthase